MLSYAASTKGSRRGFTFSLDNFSNKDFIEALSDSATPASRKSAPGGSQTQFDPVALIRAFEHALGRLNNLSEDLEERENELSGAVRRGEELDR